MDSMYGFWSFNHERRGQSEVQEDHKWKIVASQLAIVDQMRGNLDRIQAAKPLDKNSYTNKPMKGGKKGKAEDALKGGEGLNQKISDMKLEELGQKLLSGGSFNPSGQQQQLQQQQSGNCADKRFKSLPPAETLPRNETLGGYIFVCNNDTMAEDLKRQLFGMLLSLRFFFPPSLLLMHMCMCFARPSPCFCN
jgi:hypothetical protein